MAAEEEAREIKKLRAEINHRIDEAQLSQIILAVDAQVRFSRIMLGHEPHSSTEPLMAYGGILAHGTSMSAAETARMMPRLDANSVRQAMRWAAAMNDACPMPMRRCWLTCTAIPSPLHGGVLISRRPT
ncbi:MAG: Tn3 family transposase [Steroidobacteraceae bacterium]